MATIETVHFQLNDGVDQDKFLKQNAYVEHNFVAQQPGFVSRETAHSEDGKDWVVVLHWERPEDAQGSMDKFVAAQETKEFTSMIDMDTFKMTRYVKVDVT